MVFKMGTAILTRTVDLYFAFMPGVTVIDHTVLESWQWKYCWDLAAHVEQERINATHLQLV